jgi:hypothetical protein
MATQPWHYASNQFDRTTFDNYKLMSILSPDHTARLEAENSDPDIMALWNAYKPLDLAFATAYASWIAAKGFYKGSTASVDQLLATLSSTKIKQWDAQVQGVFLEGTPDYIAIFPSGRAPFQEGAKDQRINEVQSLGIRLNVYPALAATETDVNNFYATLLSARNTQQTKEMGVSTGSGDVETARINSAVQMYFTLGTLMAKFKDDPSQIERFWQMSLLRSTGGDIILTDNIAGGDTDNILSGGFDDTTEFEITNTGTTLLKFCTGTSPSDTSAVGVELIKGATVTKTALELGVAGYTFLNVKNLDATNQGSWKVKVL